MVADAENVEFLMLIRIFISIPPVSGKDSRSMQFRRLRHKAALKKKRDCGIAEVRRLAEEPHNGKIRRDQESETCK
jgi:hypothetical protein